MEEVTIVCKIKFTVYGRNYDGPYYDIKNERESDTSGVARVRFNVPHEDLKDIDKIRETAAQRFRKKVTTKSIYDSGINIHGIDLPRDRYNIDVEVLKCWRQVMVKKVVKLIRLDEPLVIDV